MQSVEDKLKYDCLTCPYPRYKDEDHIYCDVCIREIMDRHKPQMEPTGETAKQEPTNTEPPC